ncbi:MAG: alpha/beta fold hydrolase [Lentisphaeria bacterium]|nr:alpha/beta fold hydrolase [Lentisphaeria bacterium]
MMKKASLLITALFSTAAMLAENIPVSEKPMIEQKFFEEQYSLYRAHFSKNAPAKVDPAPQMEKEFQFQGLKVQVLSYQVEADERIRGYLVFPEKMTPGEKRPLVLCLHGTSLYGKDAPLGYLAAYAPAKNKAEENKRINRMQALHLAQRGFICFLPDRAGYGVRRPPEYKNITHNAAKAQNAYIKEHAKNHPGWDYRRGKVIHDLQQALDFLVKMPEIDGEKIGVIGHSLGGTDSAELAAADKRIKAAVVSCGGGITFRPELWNDPAALKEAVKKFLIMPEERNLTFQAIIPRGIFLLVGVTDKYSPQSMMHSTRIFRDCYLARMSRKEFEKRQPFVVMLHSAGHDMPEYVRDAMYRWLEMQLMSPR